MKFLFSFSLFALIWSAYYLAKRKTGGILTITDLLVCGTVVFLCLITIACYLYRKYKTKNKRKVNHILKNQIAAFYKRLF